MTLLQPTKISGRVEAVLIGANRSEGLEKAQINSVQVTFAGFEGDCHAGLTRPADVRVRKQYSKNTPIRNTRQVSILSGATSRDKRVELAGLDAADGEARLSDILNRGR